MTKKRSSKDMLDEYDFSKGEKGRYYSKYRVGTNVVVLDPDVAKVFKDQKFINESLRALASVLKLKEGLTSRSSGRR